MDSELSIDEIVTALHFSLEETLKISLGPFVDKFNSSRNQFNVVSDLLKQLPEYKEIIKHNVMLAEENRILKEYIRKQNTKNNTTNRIKLEISEKDDDEEEELDDGEEVVEVDDEEEEVEEVDDEKEEEEVEVVEVDDEKEEEEVEVDDEEEEEEVEVVEVVEVDDEKEEEEVEVDDEEEVEEDDDEISNNDVSQTPRSVVNTNEENEDEDEDEDEDEEEEGLIEVVISGKDYFADNDEDGDIYEKISDDEPGDEPIGIFKEGVATFF